MSFRIDWARFAKQLIPVNCACGRKAYIEERLEVSDDSRVVCTRDGCWEGPYRKTENQAVAAWNKLMGRPKK